MKPTRITYSLVTLALLLVSISVGTATAAVLSRTQQNIVVKPAAPASNPNQPAYEFFQLSFPFAKPFNYSSYLDHLSPNYSYNDDSIQPYTGESASAPRQQMACGSTARGRNYCYQGHPGYDIPADTGTSVYATHAGTVYTVVRNNNTGYGNYVVIQDATNPQFYTLYGHNNSIPPNIQQGVQVARGQTIAFSGNTGNSTGPHLHFGSYVNGFQDAVGNVIDPYGWFSQASNPIGAPVTDLKWASGYAPTNQNTDPINWNEGTLIGNAYVNKARGVQAAYQIGSSVSNDAIEQWWANNYGSAGAPTRGVYSDPTRGVCQDFEGGTYCTDGSYRTVIVGNGAFTDTPLNSWAHRYIGWAHREGIMNGYNDAGRCAGNPPCFLPDNPITRAEFATVMVNGFNIPTNTSGGPHYCDVPTSYWAYSAIETLYNVNIMRGQPGASCGYSNLYFQPASNIKRGELSKVIVTFAQYKGWIGSLSTTGGPDYCDVPDPSASVCPLNGYQMWYGYVETLYNNRVIQWRKEERGADSGGLFRPNLDATRAQIAMLFHELVYAARNGQ